MSTYLSVDLDYWYRGRKACAKFINKVLELKVPTLVVFDHENLLKDVNNSGCRRIEHVDYHSDVSNYPTPYEIEHCGYDKGELDLNEGTWLSFVEWRQHGDLVWRPPSLVDCYKHGAGTCHGGADPFEEPACCGWANTKVQQGLARIPWNDVSRVGIAISRPWWRDKTGRAYRDVLHILLGERTFETALSKIEEAQEVFPK